MKNIDGSSGCSYPDFPGLPLVGLLASRLVLKSRHALKQKNLSFSEPGIVQLAAACSPSQKHHERGSAN